MLCMYDMFGNYMLLKQGKDHCYSNNPFSYGIPIIYPVDKVYYNKVPNQSQPLCFRYGCQLDSQKDQICQGVVEHGA